MSEERLSEKARVLKRLCDALVNQERIAWPPGSHNLLPVGEVPMPIFRGKECGGDSAQVRLNELRMPEQRSKGYCGIPIHKAVHFYEWNNERLRVVTYKLGLNNPESVSKLIDIPRCKIDKEVLDQAGCTLIEFDDDADGKDKSGKAVKIVTKQSLEQHRQQRTANRDLHPPATQHQLS